MMNKNEMERMIRDLSHRVAILEDGEFDVTDPETSTKIKAMNALFELRMMKGAMPPWRKELKAEIDRWIENVLFAMDFQGMYKDSDADIRLTIEKQLENGKSTISRTGFKYEIR